ncbi:MAG: CAAX prenyl protease-related protein [Tepidisphaeraceae bacterium]
MTTESDLSTDPTPPAPRAEWAYILPMGVFLAFTYVGGTWRDFYPASYVAKAVVVAILLRVCWRYYTRVRWTHLGLGFAVGVVGLIQWIGMEKLFMALGPAMDWTRMIKDIRGEAFRPDQHFESAKALWAFIAIRWAGASLVVPVMEELFWRDFLWRSVASPNDYRLQKVGEYEKMSVWGVPIAFAFVHPQWLTAIVWALLIAWLLWKTKLIGACIVAHATTNFLLGAYVLINWYGFGRDEWFFW